MRGMIGGMEEGVLNGVRTTDRGVFLRGMKLIGSYIRAHPGPFSLSVLGAMLYAAGAIGSTAVLGRVTNQVLVPAFGRGVPASHAWLGGLAIVGVASVRAFGIGLRRYFSGMSGERVMQTIRMQVSDRYRQLPAAYHREQPTGELLAHMEADVNAAVEVFFPVPFATGVMFLVLFAVISLVVTDPYLAAIGLAVIPTLMLMNRSFARRMEGPVERAQAQISRVSSVVHESIDGALIVKTLGREQAETAKLAARADVLRRERVEAGFVRAGFEPALEALPAVGIILLLAVGSWRISRGDVTFGTLVQFVSLFYLLAWPMRFIGWILGELPRAVVGKARLDEVLATPITVAPPRRPVELPAGPLGIEVQALTYRLDAVPVLNGVDLEVRADESVAIVGPTGAGKSVLTQLLVRLDDPDEGEVLLGGVNVAHVDPLVLRSAATLVFQESFLFATTVRENIVLDSGASEEAMVEAARLARADTFIRNLPQGYDTVVGERGVTLSGGQRQRVALTRALVRRPRVLVLDDATSSVDPTIEAEILAGLRRELSTTLIVVAYRLSTIRLADRVLLLDGGRITTTGTHEELLANEPRYRAIVQAYERGAA
jgi:ABC-type multidrug transport system fused ATPase/permease subunit